eukprot:m.64752 g.64752  ORF g.64752 m.64752 type:complete len:331 (-) comp7540_c0_seq1:218-1210(-)
MGGYFREFADGSPLPMCPSTDNPERAQSHLGTGCMFGAWLVLGLACAAVTQRRFNSVSVSNRSVHSARISNSYWIAYFLFVAARGAVGAVRYLYTLEHSPAADEGVFIAEGMLHGMSAMMLCFALDHQRKYRSDDPTDTHDEGTPLLEGRVCLGQVPAFSQAPMTGSAHLCLLLTLLQAINSTPLLTGFIGLQAVALVGLLVAMIHYMDSMELLYIYIGVHGSQQALQLLLILIILVTSSAKGPTVSAKLFLALGTIFTSPNALPTTYWAKVLPDGCPLHVASWPDVVLFMDVFSLIFFLLFLRSEFLRYKNSCIHDYVSHINTLKFRKF